MHTTSETLLERLRQPDDQDAWNRFVSLYTPLLCHWARRLGLPAQEVGDLVQEVFVTLVQKMAAFQYDGRRSFRGWLRTVAVNRWRNLRRRRPLPVHPSAELDNLAEADADTVFEEAEYRRHLVRRALQLMQREFQPTTWQACWEYLVVGRPADDVARELHLSVNAVYLAKSRVLHRLRQELHDLLD